MMTRLAKAPANTVFRGCRVAMIAAMRKVLSPKLWSVAHPKRRSRSNSPISETTIIIKAWKKASRGELHRVRRTTLPRGIYFELTEVIAILSHVHHAADDLLGDPL